LKIKELKHEKDISKNNSKNNYRTSTVQGYDSCSEESKTWNDTSYKKATDELYKLLAECYSVTLTTRAQSTAVMRELNKLLVAKGLTFNDGTKF